MPKGKRKGVGVSVKPPRRVAVALKVAPGSGKQCEDALATARGKIHLQDIGVSDVRIRYSSRMDTDRGTRGRKRR